MGGGGPGGGGGGGRGGRRREEEDEEEEGGEGELIQRFTYTRTCLSHVIERSAAIYKGRKKVWLESPRRSLKGRMKIAGSAEMWRKSVSYVDIGSLQRHS